MITDEACTKELVTIYRLSARSWRRNLPAKGDSEFAAYTQQLRDWLHDAMQHCIYGVTVHDDTKVNYLLHARWALSCALNYEKRINNECRKVA